MDRFNLVMCNVGVLMLSLELLIDCAETVLTTILER